MTDKEVQKKINDALELKKQGKFEDAMKLYSEFYEQLIRDAFEATGGIGKFEERDEIKVNKYLKGDNLACTVLNNMGVILAEAGNKEGARNYFEESIKLTPNGLDYPNPKVGLKELE